MYRDWSITWKVFIVKNWVWEQEEEEEEEDWVRGLRGVVVVLGSVKEEAVAALAFAMLLVRGLEVLL